MLKFQYNFIDSIDPTKSFSVIAVGQSRDELTSILIKKKNVVALYYFLKKFPGLPQHLTDIVSSEIKKNAKVNDIEDIDFPKRKGIRNYESVSIVSEDMNSFFNF